MSDYWFSVPQTYGDTWGKIQRALAIWSGFGMTLTGVQTCGDYMFSGHTVVITLLNFFVTECEDPFFCWPSLSLVRVCFLFRAVIFPSRKEAAVMIKGKRILFHF